MIFALGCIDLGRVYRLGLCGLHRVRCSLGEFMDLLREQIYAGLANLPSEIGEVDFGSGICLRRTYAYLTAPFLMAFSPAPPNGSHPAPWAAVKGGLSLDITYELHVPESFSPPNFFDRLNTD